MDAEPADVSTALKQYRSNINTIMTRIDGIIDRCVDNFDDIHANKFVRARIEESLIHLNVYLKKHIKIHGKFNETINCFKSIHDYSQEKLKELQELQKDIDVLLADLKSASSGTDKSIYQTKIIPKLRKIVEQYRKISLMNGVKQCLETGIVKPLTMLEEKIIHPLKKFITTFINTSGTKQETLPSPVIKEEIMLEEILQRIAKSIPKEGGRHYSRRRSNISLRRKKTRKNIRKKLNILY